MHQKMVLIIRVRISISLGGADGAVKEAIYLAGIAGKVTIVCVEDELVCITRI